MRSQICRENKALVLSTLLEVQGNEHPYLVARSVTFFVKNKVASFQFPSTYLSDF